VRHHRMSTERHSHHRDHSSSSRESHAHGVSASTARDIDSILSSPLSTFDASHLQARSEWRELSDGGYSEVYRAKLLGQTVAVKQATSRKKTSADALLREIRYLTLAGPHPNIVTAYGAFEERGKLHLVLEFAACLRNDRIARSCDPVPVFAGISRALVHLHGLGILHRDLKARNVLLTADHRPLLIDFGLACHVGRDPAEWVCRTVGTKKYRPPEMRDGRQAQPSMDVYCCGLMVEKLLRQRREGEAGSSRRADEEAPAASLLMGGGSGGAVGGGIDSRG
jgi:serine/threonine-protein kinase 24/25/MST4